MKYILTSYKKTWKGRLLETRAPHVGANARLFTKCHSFLFDDDNDYEDNNAKDIAIPQVFSENSRAKYVRKGHKCWSKAYHLFKTCFIPFQKQLPSFWALFKMSSLIQASLTHYQMTYFRLPKLKDFADDNFKFDENGRKLSKPVENTVGKGEIAHYE